MRLHYLVKLKIRVFVKILMLEKSEAQEIIHIQIQIYLRHKPYITECDIIIRQMCL